MGFFIRFWGVFKPNWYSAGFIMVLRYFFNRVNNDYFSFY